MRETPNNFEARRVSFLKDAFVSAMKYTFFQLLFMCVYVHINSSRKILRNRNLCFFRIFKVITSHAFGQTYIWLICFVFFSVEKILLWWIRHGLVVIWNKFIILKYLWIWEQTQDKFTFWSEYVILFKVKYSFRWKIFK